MVIVDDLSPGHNLPGPMDVHVESVDWNPGKRRRAIVELGDAIGQPLRLVDYEGANLSVNWEPGRWYRIANCAVKKGGGGFDLELAPSKRTKIEPLNDTGATTTSVFVLGDTHVGYRHRSEKSPGAERVDNRKTFTAALTRAREAGVDAVVHAGDIFDDDPDQSDLDTVYREVSQTVEQGIPFYFVRGNHDKTTGRKVLAQLTREYSNCKPLGSEPVHFEDSESLVYGFDHTGTTIPELPDATSLNERCQNIFVMHETPFPIVDEEDEPIYKAEGPDLRVYILLADIDIDLVITGHMHRGSSGFVRGLDIPVITTGPTAPINDSRKDNKPSTWMLTLGDGPPSIDRRPL